MKKLLVYSMAFAAPAAFAIANDEVCFYEHAYYGGAQMCRSLTYGPSSNALPDSWNDKVSSIEVGSGVSVEMFENGNFSGKRWFYQNSTNSIGEANDKATSYRIHPKNAKNACIYEHGNYGGESYCFPVSYNQQSVDLIGLGWNDKISSISVDPGVSMSGYQDGGNVGYDQTYGSNTPYIGIYNDRFSSLMLSIPNRVCLYQEANYLGGDICWNWPGNPVAVSSLGYFNDATSSLKVPVGLKVTAYRDYNFQNKLGEFAGNKPWLGSNNDLFSSIVISSAELD